MIRHDLNEFPRFQMDANVISRDLDQLEARQTTGDVCLGAVDGGATTQRHRAKRIVFDPLLVLDPPVGG
ncbi:MAG: hypothetical protein NTAFB05_00730 [Nitrobacter sp.]